MKKIGYVIAVILFSVCFASYVYSQKISGFWQGIVFNTDTSVIQVIHLEFKIYGGSIDGELHSQLMGDNKMETMKIVGTKNNNLYFLRLKNIKSGQYLSKNDFDINLEFLDSTEYLKGNFFQDTTKSIVLYKVDKVKSFNDFNTSNNWVNTLIEELKKDISSPQKRKLELKNFQFQTIYFDYDSYEIRKEYYSYLNNVVRMLNSHSDLRLKITGHTDSDGSNIYNFDLSKNRVESLMNYFESKGIKKSKIVIDFMGETDPIDTNDTDYGKQQNRRVNFTFI